MLELDCECSGTGMGLAQSSSLIAESDILFRLFLSVCLNAFVTEIKKKRSLENGTEKEIRVLGWSQ